MMDKSCTILLIAVLLSLAGCFDKTPEPQPSDTVLRTKNRSHRNSWIDENDYYSEDLTPRDFSQLDGWTQTIDALPVHSSVYFSFNSANIDATEREKLKALAEELQAQPENTVIIEGHCDWHGTTEYNLTLGDCRANNVKNYLAQSGIAANRIETISKGSLEATYGLDKVAAREDRRGDVKIITH